MGTCTACSGTGFQAIAVGNSFDRDYSSVCPHCGGSGSIPDPVRPAYKPKPAPKPATRRASKSRKVAPAKAKPASKGGSDDWSWGFAVLSFLLGAGIAADVWGLETEGVFIAGGVAALIGGAFYKQIIGLGVVVGVIYFLSLQS